MKRLVGRGIRQHDVDGFPPIDRLVSDAVICSETFGNVSKSEQLLELSRQGEIEQFGTFGPR